MPIRGYPWLRWLPPLAGGTLAFGLWALLSGQPTGLVALAMAAALGLVVAHAGASSSWAGLVERELTGVGTRSVLLEEQVRQQRHAVDKLADGMELAVFLCDARGEIKYANRRAAELFKLDRPAGRTLLAATLSYDLERLLLEAARAKGEASAEIQFGYPQDRVGLAKAWCESEDGKRLFVSILDITDLRRLERVRQDFVANVSHELRTPMASIRAMAETLLDESEPATRDRYLRMIVGEVDRLTSISDDLLVLSAAEASPAKGGRCDLAEVARGVVGQLRSKAAGKGLDLSLEASAPVLVPADEGPMTQVALNLIDNAVKYTSEGSVKVRVYAEGKEAVLEVRDTGIGIATEHHPRIFERFYRVDKARSRQTGGTGLGLSIVRHIVESLGGTVSFESALNRGSTFTARFPT